MLHDVQIGTVTAAAAREIFGVVLVDENHRVDQAATRARRAAMRAERIGKPVADELCERRAVPASHSPLGEYLQQVGNSEQRFVQCTWCGHQISHGSERWKDRAVQLVVPISAAGDCRAAAPGLILRQFCCPVCATSFDLEVTLGTDPPLYDDVRGWPNASNGRAQPSQRKLKSI